MPIGEIGFVVALVVRFHQLVARVPRDAVDPERANVEMTPDEMEVKCQDERSQTKNYERAMRILRSRLFERQQERLHKERADARKGQIGSGGRNDRIRTYNFPQNRVTDHRINLTLHTLDSVIMGELDPVVQALREYDKKQRLGQI